MLKNKLNDNNLFFGNNVLINQLLGKIGTEELHLTFDYHTSQIFEDNRGEMSDILITSSTSFLSIECKYLSNLNFEKDVIEVQARIKRYSEHMNKTPLQIILVKKQKWGYSKNMKISLNNSIDVPIIVLFWEDIYLIIQDEFVKKYLEVQLARKK